MIHFIKRNFLYLLSLLSGILLSLSFLKFKIEWLVWFALVPLFILVEKENKYKSLIKEATLCGVIFFGICLYWLYFVTILGLIAVVVYLSTYFILFTLCLKFLYRKKAITSLNQLFVIPSLWVVLEYMRSHLFTGFGWVNLGYSQYQNLNFIQIADITGVYGVSFLIVLVNVAIKEIIVNTKSIFLFEKEKLKKVALIGTITILVMLFVYGYGDIKLNKSIEGRDVKVSVIQGNIPQSQKWEPFYRDLILEKYKKLTKMASFDEPDLIIWPETALPGYLNEFELFKEITQLACDIELPLLIGAARIDDYKGDYYNSAALISKDGNLLDVYDKIHLVPFGEYIPLPFIFGFLRSYIETANFSKGEIYTIFNVNPVRNSSIYNSIEDKKVSAKKLGISNGVKDTHLGVLICFEDVFSDLVRNFVSRGADFMVNITNDAWFMKSSEPYQHLQTSVFRAIENRINLIRVANTGISCFIDPYGRVSNRVTCKANDIFVDGYRTQIVKIKKIKSFYTQFGDIFILISLAIIMVYVIKPIIKRQPKI